VGWNRGVAWNYPEVIPMWSCEVTFSHSEDSDSKTYKVALYSTSYEQFSCLSASVDSAWT
jgi:hypothetical protein